MARKNKQHKANPMYQPHPYEVRYLDSRNRMKVKTIRGRNEDQVVDRFYELVDELQEIECSCIISVERV